MAFLKDTVVLLNFLPSFDSSYASKGNIYPAVGILLIGSILRQHGFKVEIIDGAYDENYLGTLTDCVTREKDRLLYVGMSVMTTQVPLALEASRAAKAIDNRVPIVWGGAHPSLFPEQTLLEKSVDVVAVNEGAVTAVKIAKAFQSGDDLSDIDGIGYKDRDGKTQNLRSAGVEDIRDLPFFDFSLIELDRYLGNRASVYQREFPRFKSKVKILPILTGLGCPYKCQFCINVILKRRYRFRDAASIVAEIIRLQSEYDVNTFIFMDEDFFINKRRVYEFLDLVEEKKLHFNWRMWCRVDHFKESYINKDLLERLGNIGYGSLVMGGESGNQEILDQLKKQITTDQILYSLKCLEGTKITPRYSFIVGLENETIHQIKTTFDFCFELKRLREDVDIACFVFRLYPGSPIYNRLVEHHQMKIPTDLDSWSAFLMKSDSYTAMPWAPEEFQKNLKYIEFCMNFSIPVHVSTSAFKDLLKQVFASICRYRLRTFNFHFPIEYTLWQWVVRLRTGRVR